MENVKGKRKNIKGKRKNVKGKFLKINVINEYGW